VFIGDAVHNLRAALDHVVYELASVHHGTGPLPPKMARDSGFPILKWSPPVKGGETPQQRFDNTARTKLAGCPKEVHALVEAEQPYHEGEAYARHPLWQLSRLDNYDKHRTLPVTAAAIRGPFVGVRGDVEPRVTFWSAGGRVQDGQALVVYSHAAEGARAYITREVWFGEPAPIAGSSSVEDTLGTLTAYVSDLARALAAHL
jgi:hypothetical protein